MSEYSEILHKAATRPDQLNDADIAALRRACIEHPADAIAPALLLKYADGSLDDDERAVARARVSLYSGQPATLVSAIDPSGKGFNSFYPRLPSENRPTTSGAIDLFLETYGHQSAQEDALLERMIFNPVPDYAEQLNRQENPIHRDAPANTQDSLIDAFLATHSPETPEDKATAAVQESPAQDPQKQSKKNPTPTPSLLSESLAKIFIKQGRYERAHEIISNLSLNYPEKSVYFADQLRFLEKLIINQRHAK